jgi:hypothetical protein
MQNRQSRFCANLEQSILKSLRLAHSYERILITVDDSESGQHLGGKQVGGYVPLRRQPIFRAEPNHTRLDWFAIFLPLFPALPSIAVT